jgi:hypothetical protein
LIKNLLTLTILVHLSLLTQAQVATIYTLPVFEVSKTNATIVGLRHGKSDSYLHCLPNRKSGIYLNNPFLEKKWITEVHLKFKKIGRKIDALRIEIFPAGTDSFPVEIALFDTTFDISKERNYWLKVTTPKISFPQNGVVLAYTLISHHGELLNSKQTGGIASKTYSQAHRIRFDYWEGNWNRYPFEESRKDSIVGHLVRELEKKLPFLSLTLVN